MVVVAATLHRRGEGHVTGGKEKEEEDVEEGGTPLPETESFKTGTACG